MCSVWLLVINKRKRNEKLAENLPLYSVLICFLPLCSNVCQNVL